MKNIFFVTRDQHDLARRAEQLLLDVPAIGGILFVGATIKQGYEYALSVDWDLSIVVGCARNLEVSAVEALVWSVLAKDPDLDAIKDRTKVEVYRGVARSPR